LRFTAELGFQRYCNVCFFLISSSLILAFFLTSEGMKTLFAGLLIFRRSSSLVFWLSILVARTSGLTSGASSPLSSSAILSKVFYTVGRPNVLSIVMGTEIRVSLGSSSFYDDVLMIFELGM